MSRSNQINEVISEFLLAREKGETVDRDSLRAEHPEIADELDEFFVQHDQLNEAVSGPDRSTLKVDPDRSSDAEPIDVTCDFSDRLERPTLTPKSDDANKRGSSVDMPEMVFGQYELVSEIARGGMGVVYRARHCDLNRIVALKMIQTGRLASHVEIDRFHAEAGAVACLSHPGIVPLYEFGEIQGWHFYTMELVDGTDLEAMTRSQSMSLERAATIVLQLARATHHAHEKGIIHRDLKPSNVLIDSKGNPRITDFGLAKRLNEKEALTVTGQILGTASFMSPEQAAGSNDVDERADIYALGAILFSLIAGHPPFQADNQLDLLLRVLEGEPKSPRISRRETPKSLEQICMKCLRRNKGERYATAHDLAEDLDRYLSGDQVEAAPARPWTRVQRFARQKPALTAHLGGLAMIEIFRHARYLMGSLESLNELRYHLTFSALFIVWGLLSIVLQTVSDRPRFSSVARYLWIGMDVVMATSALSIVKGDLGMLIVCLALIIVGAGSFSRVSLVVWATCATLSSFLFLLVIRPELREPDQYAPIMFSFLTVFGIMVGVQVNRLRLLSRRLGE